VETDITEAARALQPPLVLTDVLTDELLLGRFSVSSKRKSWRGPRLGACNNRARTALSRGRAVAAALPPTRRAWRAKQNAHAFAGALQARRRALRTGWCFGKAGETSTIRW
jgi:hypothetical protein